MFKNFRGFDLVESYQQSKMAKRLSDANLMSKITRLAISAIALIVLWAMPTECFGIEGLTLVEQRTIAIFVFAKYRLSRTEFKAEHQKLILDISKLTFGVYMIHVVLLALLDKFGFSPLTYPAVYMIPMLILFVLPMSFFLSFLVGKIPLLGRYIV